MTSPLPTALEYANRGWRIVPIRPGEKRPALNGWQNIASADPELITEWFTGPYHDHGIGIVAGFGVGDVDVEDEESGFGAGGDADSVILIGAGEPFCYEFRIC